MFYYRNKTFTDLKKSIYFVLLPVFLIAFVFVFWILKQGNHLNSINIFTFSVLCIGLFSCFILLWYRNFPFILIESFVCLVAVFIYSFRLYYNIYYDLGAHGDHHLGTVSFWYPIVYILLFFTFRGKAVLYLSSLTFTITLIPGIYHIFSPRADSSTLDTIVQYYIANIGFIIALYFFQRVLEVYLQAEVANHNANTDYLTNLPNRRKLDVNLNERVKEAMDGKSSLSVILFDVDHFKKVNDIYGHDIGDQVLVEIAVLVKEHLPSESHFGRWGGEEFLIIVQNSLNVAQEHANKVKEVIENHTFTMVESITCSFGVAELTDGKLKNDLLKSADQALYKAKEMGRNHVVISKDNQIIVL